MKRTVAIIAGTGSLPLEACNYFLATKEPFFVVSLFPDDNGMALKEKVAPHGEIITEKYYKIGSILNILRARNTTDVLFIGKVDKQHLLKKLSLDWLALKILAQTLTRSDKQVMEALIAELASHNIAVLSQHTVLSPLTIPAGVLCGTLTEALSNDIQIGMNVALSLAHADIGQTVIVKDGMVLAVEAIEGTDSCIRRGIELGKTKVVICKTARKDQNKKYDLPTLGPQTIAHLAIDQVAAIAWQSELTFIAQKDDFLACAQQKNIVLVSV